MTAGRRSESAATSYVALLRKKGAKCFIFTMGISRAGAPIFMLRGVAKRHERLHRSVPLWVLVSFVLGISWFLSFVLVVGQPDTRPLYNASGPNAEDIRHFRGSNILRTSTIAARRFHPRLMILHLCEILHRASLPYTANPQFLGAYGQTSTKHRRCCRAPFAPSGCPARGLFFRAQSRKKPSSLGKDFWTYSFSLLPFAICPLPFDFLLRLRRTAHPALSFAFCTLRFDFHLQLFRAVLISLS
jgi:hypothetical protein